MEEPTGGPCGPRSVQLVALRVAFWLYVVVALAVWLCVLCIAEEGKEL